MLEWEQTAKDIALQRISMFEDRVMSKVSSYDKAFEAFTDPAFQILIRKAQISAACSDREEDYDILADLLLHRVEKKTDCYKKLAISKAIEVVDAIDKHALVALSVMYALHVYKPVSKNIDDGLSALDELFSKIIGENSLPNGRDWIEHADLLGAARMSPNIMSFKKFEEVEQLQLPFYFFKGIELNSEQHLQIISEFKKCGLPNCLNEITLKKGFLFVDLPTFDLDDIIISSNVNGQLSKMHLNSQQKDCLSKTIKIANNPDYNDTAIKNHFWEKWNQHTTLNTIREWWNKLPILFETTLMGDALASAYIKGRYPQIPAMF